MINVSFDNKTNKLSNGLTVITVKKETELFSINVGIKIGAYYENDNNRGIAHFIEHMLFKGTRNRKNEDLNMELEFLGGEYNAYTNYNSTVYSISCLVEESNNAVDLISDMILHPAFNKDELEREKGVVISEIRSAKDDIAEFSANKVFNSAFDESPLRYEVAGNEKVVSSFTKKEITDYYNKSYTPDNSVISVVSPYDHDDVVKMIEERFGSWTGKCQIDRTVVKEKNKVETFTSKRKDIEQSTITILFSFLELEKKKELPLKILNHQLGDSANSILFRELREKRGLVYDVYTDLDLCHNAKTLCIYTAVQESKIDETINAIFKCINDIKNKNIVFNERTLELMRKVHKTSVISTFEDGSDLCNYMLTQELEGEDIMEFMKDMKRLREIDADSIYDVAQEVLVNPTIHILRGND